MSLAPSMRAALAASDPDVPFTELRTMEAFLADWVRPVTFFVRTMGTLSLLALAIAAVGLYGVMAYAVSQRTHEIGVRVALGATAPRIVRLLARHGLQLGVMGAVLGIGGALLLTGVLRQILFGTSPTDPAVFAVVTAVLLAVVLAASVIPARRALRVNPVEALRSD
jgi:ABC-type antimicrobial peptide transport system permease subunit